MTLLSETFTILAVLTHNCVRLSNRFLCIWEHIESCTSIYVYCFITIIYLHWLSFVTVSYCVFKFHSELVLSVSLDLIRRVSGVSFSRYYKLHNSCDQMIICSRCTMNLIHFFLFSSISIKLILVDIFLCEFLLSSSSFSSLPHHYSVSFYSFFCSLSFFVYLSSHWIICSYSF